MRSRYPRRRVDNSRVGSGRVPLFPYDLSLVKRSHPPLTFPRFCYSGGFALNAAVGGASRVLAVDSSQPALEEARINAGRNGLDRMVEFVKDDALAFMKARRAHSHASVAPRHSKGRTRRSACRFEETVARNPPTPNQHSPTSSSAYTSHVAVCYVPRVTGRGDHRRPLRRGGAGSPEACAE